MTDYFSLLNFERTPWLEPDLVKARFLELSAPAHPDRVHGLSAEETARANEVFAELNTAANVLREPRERLQHLLLLETGQNSAATQNIAPELIEVFGKVGMCCRSVDEFLAKRTATSSPILQAQLFGEGLDWSDRVSELQSEVSVLKGRAEEELKTIAAGWPNEKPIARLRELAHRLATIARWEKQLQDRFSILAAG